MVKSFSCQLELPEGTLYSYPNSGMVPGYKQIVPDPRPMSNLRVADFLTLPPSVTVCWHGSTIPTIYLNISKVPVTIISKAIKHHVHFFRMTLPLNHRKEIEKCPVQCLSLMVNQCYPHFSKSHLWIFLNL